MSNVIKFEPKEKMWTLKFICPQVVSVNKTKDDDFAIELNRGAGTAWVPAKTKVEAKRKLHAVIKITEWIDD
jgi:hypothetical protein